MGQYEMGYYWTDYPTSARLTYLDYYQHLGKVPGKKGTEREHKTTVNYN